LLVYNAVRQRRGASGAAATGRWPRRWVECPDLPNAAVNKRDDPCTYRAKERGLKALVQNRSDFRPFFASSWAKTTPLFGRGTSGLKSKKRRFRTNRTRQFEFCRLPVPIPLPGNRPGGIVYCLVSASDTHAQWQPRDLTHCSGGCAEAIREEMGPRTRKYSSIGRRYPNRRFFFFSRLVLPWGRVWRRPEC